MTWPDENTALGWDRFRAARTGVRPPRRCQCGGVRFMCHDVDSHHELFGVLIPCTRCNADYALRNGMRGANQ